MSEEDQSHHVHFGKEVEDTNEVVIKSKGNDKLEFHLGFLQVNHIYEVVIIISHRLFPIFRGSAR